jgi:hypothetical protein
MLDPGYSDIAPVLDVDIEPVVQGLRDQNAIPFIAD